MRCAILMALAIVLTACSSATEPAPPPCFAPGDTVAWLVVTYPDRVERHAILASKDFCL